jgi:uncharacterized iron-regulated membrane protein
MKIISFCRSVHAWGGFILALLILLISLTGSLLVWKKEYLWLTVPESRAPTQITAELAATVADAAQAHFGLDVLLLQFGHENLALHKVYMPDSQYALLDNTGAIIDQWRLNDRPEEWLYDLHHRLLLGNTGLNIAGISALVMLLLVFFGLIAWWPSRKLFNWRLWISGWPRNKLLNTHRNIGIVAALPTCVLLLTGAVLSFPFQAQKLLLTDYHYSQEYSDLYTVGLDGLNGTENGERLVAFKRALASFPEGAIRSVEPPSRMSGYRLIGMQQNANEWHQSGLSRVYIAPDTGYMDMRLDAASLSMVEQLYNLSYPLHTAKADRLWYRVVVFIFGIAMCLLSFLGCVSFVKKLTKTPST